MTGRLQGKVAFITGAGGGIGRAGALAFAREGARVVIAEIARETGEESARAVTAGGGQAVFVRTDVTDPESVRTALAEGERAFGPLDILYNNAGYSMPEDRSIETLDEAVWKETFDVVLYGTFLCAKYALPGMIERRRGVIINTASIAGLAPSKGTQAYSVAKAGVVQLTRNLASANAQHGIRANCLCPGLTMSPRWRERIHREPALRASMAVKQPFGYCEPEDIAAGAVFLASDEARMITGLALPIDGGYMAS